MDGLDQSLEDIIEKRKAGGGGNREPIVKVGMWQGRIARG